MWPRNLRKVEVHVPRVLELDPGYLDDLLGRAASLWRCDLEHGSRGRRVFQHVRPQLHRVLSHESYGFGPCWAGAFEGLKRIKDIKVVRPVPDGEDSVAFVYLKEDILPDIDVW